MSTNIGGLYSTLGLDMSEFARGIASAQGALAKFAREITSQLAGIEDKVRKVGVGLSVGVTAPFAGLVVAATRGAATFETAMNKVNAAVDRATPEQLEALAKQARTLGPAVGRSAVEAAEGIENLALAGTSVQAILGGALDATLKLAAANDAELAPAASAITDIMAQFGKTAADLPEVVNKITGALDSSKFGFIDLQQAISQAGGVAGSVGVSFDDFTTALAGTAYAFDSGADAGTSFKTFITSLNPKSKEAEGVFEKLGKRIGVTGRLFFDASGKAKSLAEVSDILNRSLGDLSDASRNEALTKAFGSDAMRTAIGLMKLGKKGFEDLEATIAEGDAGTKLAKQMQGYEAATNRLAAAFEGLKISIGATGILSAVTSVTNALGGFVSGMANANPLLLKITVGVFGLAAALGPLLLGLIGVAKLGMVLLIGRLGILGAIVGALINPIGALVVVVIRLGLAIAGVSVASAFGAALIGLAAPIGLVITAIGLLVLYLSSTTKASDRFAKASALAKKAQDAQAESALQLATATGEARRALLAKIRLDQQAAAAAVKTAKADLAAALASRERARADAALMVAGARGFGPDAMVSAMKGGQVAAEQADLDARTAIATLNAQVKVLEGYTASIAAGSAPESGTVDLNFDDDKTKKGRSEAEKRARYLDELGRIRVQILQANADLSESLEDRATAERAAIEEDRASFERGVKGDGDLTDARKAELVAQNAKLAGVKLAAAQQDEQRQIAQRTYDLESAGNQNAQDLVQSQISLARTAKERRKLELRLLALQYSEERAQLERIKATSAANSEKYRNADSRLAVLDKLQAQDADSIREATRGPAESYLAGIYKSAAEQAEAFEESAVSGLRSLDDKLTETAAKVFKLGGVFGSVANSIIADLIRIAVQKNITGPLANALFGGGTGASSGGGFLSKIGGALKGVLGGGGLSGGGFAKIAPSVLGTSSLASGVDFSKLPKFATGGSFTVGGRGGIDKNLVQFAATKGEMVNITKGNNDNGSSRHVTVHVEASPYFDTRVSQVAAPLAQAAQVGAVAQTEDRAGRRARRRL